MKRSLNKRIVDHLAKNHTCYILITCNSAEADGNMQVEMTYEGDPALAACLLQGAQNMIDEQVSAALLS
ncbi:MAG: hypothetical protein H0U49_01495 [Parachlamydiaceae bacterium]|nr:hypothetical protein [Parachlamydiaceae bacterium]